MANVKLGIFILIATILAPETSAAQTWEVGDTKGWTKGVDFQKWANTWYDMMPGDSLAFKYPPGTESVVEVDQKAYEQCVVPPSAKVLKSGNDVILLAKPGPKYFISGNANHCKEGMKFRVLVLDDGKKTPVKASVNLGTSGAQTWEVGDAKGWTKGVDFQKWANTWHDIMPGDSLAFKYPPRTDSVVEVDQKAYEQCVVPPSAKVLKSGNDVILLAKPGPKYFISGNANHCKEGMKFRVLVLDDGKKTPVKASVNLGTSGAQTWEVGDAKGWTKGVDFQKWANTWHDIMPGDSLAFKYPPGTESVVEVDQKAYEQCVVPPSAKVLKSGNDVILLEKPGPKYFISGNANHCKEGMKFRVLVLDDGAKTPVKSQVNPGTSAEVFVVGDDKGWCDSVDYMAWTEGKEFDIGDKLVFKYPKGKHNVFRVGEEAWNECIIPPENEALATGNDEVTLDTPGGVGFISGVGQDCKNGMRLLVNVICPNAKPKPVQGARKLAG